MKPLNLKQKKPSKFKEKIKSFFYVDIEKDLQEEEPTKVFEKLPLINLTRNKIFLGIFLFLVIVNCLVGFDINQFYIRAILGFIFLITVPGLLIMLCFKIRTVKFWEFLVYTIGLSIAFIMFAGLIVNWTLPALNITDKPLSLFPILICFDIFLATLGIVAWKRNKDFQPPQLTVPKLDALNNLFFIIPMAFPILSILGAFLLNNHGSNILTMIMLGGIAVYVLLLTTFRKKLNGNIWPWALFMMSLALLLSFSMRSWYISSIDPNLEFMISELVKNNSLWDVRALIGLSNTNYEFMLSITILPNLFFLFLKVNDYLIVKLFFQFIFSIIPLVLYLSFNKSFNKISSFLASFFFISQPMFITGLLGISPRQQIAFVFFGLMLLVFFTKEIPSILKKILFIIFGISMIVSHYSTSYITLIIFTLTYLVILIYQYNQNKKRKREKICPSKKSEFFLTGILILILFIFGFLWYNQITPTSNGLIDFVERSISNLGNIFNEEVQSNKQSFFKQLPLFSNSPPLNIKDYTDQIIKDYQEKYPSSDFYEQQTYINYNVQQKSSTSLNKNFNLDITSGIYSIRGIFKLLGNILISLGVLFFLVSQYRKKEKEIKYFLITLISFIILISLLILPFISINYDTGRIYQQMLFILSPMILFGIIFPFKEKKRYILILIFIILYFLFLSGGVQQIVGGQNVGMFSNNIGFEYDNLYTHQSEISSSQWLFKNYNPKNSIYSDSFAFDKILLTMQSPILNKIDVNIFPQLIRKKGYVFLSYNNVINNFASRLHNGIMLGYEYPKEFLNENKNKIYNDGGSEIFK